MPPPPRNLAQRLVAPASALLSVPAPAKPTAKQKPAPPLSSSNAATLASLRAGDTKPVADSSPPKALQDKVGNGAVAAGLKRSPGSDPKFATLKRDVKTKKHTVASSHPPPRKEASSAQGAARSPKDDTVAQGKTANAEKMNDAKPKDFDKDAFIKAVEKAIAEKAPKNLDEADKFATSTKPEEIKTAVQDKVGDGKRDSADQIATTTAAPPDTSAAVPKQVVPMAADRPPGAPATPNPTNAAPDQLPPSATDMSAGPAQVNKQMADAQVTEPQLQKANEPAFTTALKDKKSAEQHSDTAPDQLRKHEAGKLRDTTAHAKQAGTTAMGAIAATRVRVGQQVTDGKTGAKTRDEDKRAQVTAILQKCFDTMKTDVENILTGLDKLVDDQFTREEKDARDKFTAEHQQKMDEYKDRRYSGLIGKGRWVHDLFAGLPDEANQIFVVARDHYLERMRKVISDVADTIARELGRAKKRIADGHTELDNAVKQLPQDLQSIGQQAAAQFSDKFDELTQSVDDKGTELVDTLATKYTDAVKAVDDEIAEEKEKNKGLVDKAVDAVKGVIDTIIELKNMLLGVLAKAAAAIGAILSDPIGFLGNLISAVGGGLKLFMKNAGKHLEEGVLGWLLGAAATAGILLPTSFDIAGILLMIASLLGLTWANLRARLVRKVPEQAVAAAETAVPLVMEVRKRGVAGMWDDLKERVGDLKKNLISNLVSYLLPTILIAGITWIVSLFNPASAFIRACKMIIDIVRFIITQGRQILEFVNTVLDAIVAIAKGGAGGVPQLVENALARSIPVLIGALAAILGIGGIATKVKDIFHKLSEPVNKAIDWVIDKIAGLVKKLWEKIAGVGKKVWGKAKDLGKKAWDKTKGLGHKALSKIKGLGQKLRDKFGPKKKRPDSKDHKHDKRSDEAKKLALDAAANDALELLRAKGATPVSVKKGMPAIKRQHQLTSIKLKKFGKDDYAIQVAINPKKETSKVELTAEEFPYEIVKAQEGMTTKRTEGAKVQLDATVIPMEGLDRRIGYVINITTIPSEVQRDMAVRYFTKAWKGGAEDLAAARTAVVIGINALEHLDADKGKAEIATAIGEVATKPHFLTAFFGFVWTPVWVRVDAGTQTRADFSDVRRDFHALPAEKKPLAEKKEGGLRAKEALPFGLFRQEVLASEHTQNATAALKKINDVVYVVGQDADTDVAAQNTMGVLAAYTKILDELGDYPLLVVGGYRFRGFSWRWGDNRRKRQLTLWSNEVDRAVRSAINKVHPQMLYPTEPNMLIKAIDQRKGGVGGIFQNARTKALLNVEGGLYGIGEAEGRFLRNKLMEIFGTDFTLHYAPEASTVTSAAPGDIHRGLETTPAGVRAAARKKMLDVKEGKLVESTIRRAHRAYALIVQSQTMASAQNLSRELTLANPVLRNLPRDARLEFQRTIRKAIFDHVEDAVLLMTDNPRLTARSPEIQAILNKLQAGATRIAVSATNTPESQAMSATITEAEKIAKQIIDTLTADEFKGLWGQLRGILDRISPKRDETS